MNTPLSLAASLTALEKAAEELAQRQVADPGHPWHGAIINEALGVDEPGHTGTALFIGTALLLQVQEGPSSVRWLERLDAAVRYLLQVQRPTGRIDFRDCNYDSDPDTAFTVQLLCAALAVTREKADEPRLKQITGQLEEFVRRAAGGIAGGGFHTPNHRWVVACAMAQACALFPDLKQPLHEPMRRLLCEEPDIDEEGCFIERSVAIYDAVCDRSLLLLDELLPGGWAQGRAAALANLRFDSLLIHADGTAESGLSHRQDYGTREVPVNLISPLLQAARRTGEDEWSERAAWLWEKATAVPLSAGFWLVQELMRHPPATFKARALESCEAIFPKNKLWRVRSGDVSLSAFGGITRLVGLRFGPAEMVAIKIGQSYLSHGRFLADEMIARRGGILLKSNGYSPHGRLGYLEALGVPVPAEQWEQRRDERPLRPLPPCRSSLDVESHPDRVALHYRTESGLDRALAQISFDFLPGGVWETGDTCVQPQPGQVLFLKAGSGRMSYGSWAIEIEGGADAHRAWALRDLDPPGNFVRVLITFLTPVDHRFSIRCSRTAGLSWSDTPCAPA